MQTRQCLILAAALLLAACSAPASPAADSSAAAAGSDTIGSVSVTWSTLDDYRVALLTNSSSDPVALYVYGQPAGGNLVLVPGAGSNGGRGVLFGQAGELQLAPGPNLPPLPAEPCEPTFMQPAAPGELLGSVNLPLDAEVGPVAAYVAVLDADGSVTAIALNGGTRSMDLERSDAENVDLRVRAGSAPADPPAFACSLALVDYSLPQQ